MKALAAALGFIGRHGTLLAALSILVGLAVPPLATLLKPTLGAVIVGLVTLSFLRVDPAALRGHFKRPGLIAAAAVWLMLVAPALIGAAFLGAGLGRAMPGLFFMLVLQLSAPGLMSAPALAALLGLDMALTLAALIMSIAAAPVTAGLFTHAFLGTALTSPLALGLRLASIIAGSALVAAIVRRFAGAAFIEAQALRIDGLSVLLLIVFAIAAMDGVTAHLVSDPLLVLALTLLAFALSLGMIAMTTLVFWPAGRARAFAIGLLAGSRNTSLMLAATGFVVPDVAWLYFAVSQFPIYLLPIMLRPVARWATGEASNDG